MPPVQTRRAKALAGFRTASPLHEKQEDTRRSQTVTKLSFRMMLWFFRSIIVCEMESKEERVSLGGEGCGETISAEHLDHAF